MQFEIEGRRAFVTGAQQGIGRATALALAKAGADVCINWLDDRAAADGLAAELTALGRKAPLVQGSVATSDEVARLVGEADTALGGIDILVNNAGVFPRSPFLELAEAEWDHVLGVNLKGSFLVAQAVARAWYRRAAKARSSTYRLRRCAVTRSVCTMRRARPESSA